VFFHGGGCFPLPMCAYLNTAEGDNKFEGHCCHNSSFFEGGLSQSAMGVPFRIAGMAVFRTVMQSQGFSHDAHLFTALLPCFRQEFDARQLRGGLQNTL
jgi:hypothetical protein